MLDSFDFVKIQNLLNIKTQEMRDQLTKELKVIDQDLTEHITESFTKRVKDKDNVNLAKQIYTLQDHKNKNYIRNKDCWAYDLDLTCISPWNSTGNNTRAGTAITPYHIVFANHYQIANGATVRFITQTNEVVDRKLTKSIQIFNSDIRIGVLDQKLPSSIKPAKILPKFYRDYVAINFNHILDKDDGQLIKTFPALCLDYEEKAIINEVNTISGNANIICKEPSGQLSKFSEKIIPGDSGNPCFTIIDDQLVLLCTWLSGHYGSGPFISGNTWVSSENTLKGNIKEIQNKLYTDLLFNNDYSLMQEMLLSFIDLWRFRKVSP